MPKRNEPLKEMVPFQDSSWYVAHLTEKQRLYGLYYAKTLGDWKKAAKLAGYAPGVNQYQIESGEVMLDYMTAVKAEVAQVAAVTATAAVARVNRIALKAEEQGDLKTALAANKTLGEWQGLGDKRLTVTHVNADGAAVTITGPRDSVDDEAYMDAEIVEIMELNGVQALPPKEKE